MAVFLILSVLVVGLIIYFAKNTQTSSPSRTTANHTDNSTANPLQQISREQQNSNINLIYAQQQLKVSPQVISSWYEKKGSGYELSDTLINSYIRQVGA